MAETSTKKHLSATVIYALIGMALLWSGLMGTGFVLTQWRSGVTLSPLSLAVIHIVVLGFMMTVVFGVLYQIVPIAFQAPPINRRVLYWHLPVHIASVFTMVTGFLLLDFRVVGTGGAILCLVAVLYFTFVVQSYRKAKNPTMVHRTLGIPFAALFLVMLIGIFQAFFPSKTTLSLLLSHVLTGGFAFFGGLVIVISYKLVPMFTLSHGYKASVRRTVSLYFGGTLLWIVVVWLPKVAWTPVNLATTILLSYGLISFILDMVAIVRARKRKRIVIPVYDALFATALIIVSQVWMMVGLWTHQSFEIIVPSYLFTFGGLIPLMFAYLQKIVPFLWFEYRFSKRPERKTAPLIDDMVPKVPAQAGMILYYVGVSEGCVYLLGPRIQIDASWLTWTSASCLTAGSVLVFLSLQHVLSIGGKRPEE